MWVLLNVRIAAGDDKIVFSPSSHPPVTMALALRVNPLADKGILRRAAVSLESCAESQERTGHVGHLIGR